MSAETVNERRRFGQTTGQNVGKLFAIVLDGKILSAPVIQGAIPGGSGQITGIGTAEEANTLALLLRQPVLARALARVASCALWASKLPEEPARRLV